jgi:hypothetical protein
VLAAWNFKAGKDMPKKFNKYPEFKQYKEVGVVPNLNGWDFRINLPHTTGLKLLITVI